MKFVILAILALVAIVAVAQAQSFDRYHNELRAVYKVLDNLEAKLRRAVIRNNNRVTKRNTILSKRRAVEKATKGTLDSAQTRLNRARTEFNQAKANLEAAQREYTLSGSDFKYKTGVRDQKVSAESKARAAYETTQRFYTDLNRRVASELALINTIRGIIGNHHSTTRAPKPRRARAFKCTHVDPKRPVCYAAFVQKLSWKAASAFCAKQGGRRGGFIASIHSEADNTRALRMCGNRISWLGFSDEGHEGNWKWSDKSPVDFKKWAPGEPNNYKVNHRGEDFAEQYSNGIWNDIWEDPSKINPAAQPTCFVCERFLSRGQWRRALKRLPK